MPAVAVEIVTSYERNDMPHHGKPCGPDRAHASMRDLTGKLALVTGGGKGVGRIIAHQLAERGAHVLINCFHSYAEAKATSAAIEASGGRADVLRASVAKKPQVDRMFDEIEERFGYLDVLVNNAASGWLGPISGVTPELFAKTLDTNLLGSFLCASRAAPLMSRRGGGTIVNISSVGAGMVPDNYLMVGTSKAAIEALTRHLAAEYASAGIRVNTASCSLIEGDVAELFPDAAGMQRVVVASTPLGRLATAEDLAGVVTFLTSDLSRWVTGQVVLADGGLSLGNVMLSPPRQRALPVGEFGSSGESEPSGDSEPSPDVTSSATLEPSSDADPVVVVGMGLAVPGANSPEEYWRLLGEGAELFVETPADRWRAAAFASADPSSEDKAYQTRSGFITDFAPDSALAAELAAGDARSEYTTLWLRHSVHQALRTVHRRGDERVTFTVGYTADGSQHLEEAIVLATAKREFAAAVADMVDPEERASTEQTFADTLESHLWRGTGDASELFPDRVARGAIAGLLPGDTEVVVVDTACSSSLYAIDLGMRSLLLGDCEMAVCGGAFALGPRGAVLFSQLHGLSTGGVVRSLDRGADGVLFSDGAGVVVLKRLSRARADGDRVLGVLDGFGASSDGRGKAIYAPSSHGQKLAVERALARAQTPPEWVVAHATGTPAGDIAEFTTLREALPAEQTVQVTSNKSLIGHTGWAAGVISLIEVLKAFEHSLIPRQHRFVDAPAAFELASSSIAIPRDPVPWPAGAQPRVASVSGFGFGGTNAHLVVAERPAEVAERRTDVAGAEGVSTRQRERVAIVAWSAHFPGLDDSEGVAAWLRGTGPAPERSFGSQYRLSPGRRVRIPPSAQRVLDRGQLMFVECMFRLRESLGGVLDDFADRTGVLAGHMGPTLHAGHYAMRCYLDDLRAALGAEAEGTTALARAYDRFSERVRAAVPASTEDAFPGIMPNIIPARVANVFDLHGLNATIDTGFASALSAVTAAVRYLQDGELEFALVGGVNGNASDAINDVLGRRLVAPDGRRRAVAEGAVMFALVRESTAQAHGLPVLAHVELGGSGAPSVTCGQVAGERPSYLGAEGAVAMLEAILAPAAAATVTCIEGGAPVASLSLSRHGGEDPRLDGGAGADAADACAASTPTTETAGGQLVARHRVGLVAEAPRPVRAAVPFLTPGAVVLTDCPDRLDDLAGTAGVTVISTVPIGHPSPSRIHLAEITAASVHRTLARLRHPITDVRVVTDLSACADIADATDGALHGLLALHDLVFLGLQDRLDDLGSEDASILACLLGAVHAGEAAPPAGLFTGLLKSVGFEVPQALICATLTNAADIEQAVAQASAETANARLLPVAVYDGANRKVLAVEPAAPLASTGPAIDEQSVVLSCGGSRGIAAELLKVLATRHRPTIYVLGSNALPDSAAAAPPSRAEYLRVARRRDPDASVPELNLAYQRLCDAQIARRNLDEMAAATGGRVTYLRCNACDPDEVAGAVAQVLAAEGRVDFVLNAAGINRSGLMRGKRREDFRAVRDLKVLAYVNLKRALAGHSPLWCNFSSYIGLKGQIGETDYAAANDFIATASVFAGNVRGEREFAIGWNLWSEVGLGAAPLMKSFLSKRVWYTQMPTSEGIDHFLRELDQPRHDPWSVFMGSAEREHLGLPEAVDGGTPSAVEPPAETRPPSSSFFLGVATSRGSEEACFEREFSLERDPYLRHHVVNGTPTLPGTFAIEIAAEAARALVPDRIPVRFEQLVFSSFLRVPPGRPVTKRVRATILGRRPDETVVGVRVVTDVTAPDGRVLATDRPHFACVVRLRERLPVAPRWERPERPSDATAYEDPYHVANPAVHLTGPFVTATDFWVHARGSGATFAPAIAPDDPIFATLGLPVVLLDGLLRVSVPDQAPDISRVLAVPASIARLDVYQDANDSALAALAAPIHFTSVAPDSLGRGGRAVASFDDGRVLAQIDEMRAVVLGGLDEQGRFCPHGARSPEGSPAWA